MTSQIDIDCLSEVIEYLEKDKISLKSCLLVDHFWCKVAIRILWRNIWDIFNVYDMKKSHKTRISLSILSTLNACLPNESRTLFNENGISIPTPTPKSPL